MRKIITSTIIAISLITIGCDNNNSSNELSGNSKNNKHNPNKSDNNNDVKWTGKYAGTIPCKSCPGIKVDLTLNSDNTFVLKEEYLDKKDGIFEDKGTYEYDDVSKIVTITLGEEVKNYLIGDGKITVLDAEGKPLKSSNPNDYMLTKK